MNEDNMNLQSILNLDDETNLINSFAHYLKNNLTDSISSGVNLKLDEAVWESTKFNKLSQDDEQLLHKVTQGLLANASDEKVFSLKDFFGQTANDALNLWQDLLQSMQWQVLTPVAVTRSATDEALCLGTFSQTIANVGNVELNLNFYNKTNSLKLLVQATNKDGDALPNARVMLNKDFQEMVFVGQTNEDGIVLEPSIPLTSGIYQIDFLINDTALSTPFFKI